MIKNKLQCTINSKDCKGKAEHVCHHCGKLLCDGPNCCNRGWDSAFSGWWVVAYHCPEHSQHLSQTSNFVFRFSYRLRKLAMWLSMIS